LNNIENTIIIAAAPAIVWRFLTVPELMKQWMGDKEMEIRITTDWKVGNPILISGFHNARFENRGTVLAYEEPITLSYTHLSSLSRLPDLNENYSVIKFVLKKIDLHTQLTVRLENFPTESIYKHLDFYWKGTLGLLKAFIEGTQTA
jgi:uncharacterized protein YndB with AHSA1/START domain